MNSTLLLNDFFEQGKIALLPAPIFEHTPAPLPKNWDFARIEGMLLGLAIGDALGNTSESMLPAARRHAVGEVRDYLPNRHAGSRPVGLPSDDTQLAFWTLEQLLEDGELVPEHLAERFASRRIFGIGRTVKDFLHSYKDLHRPWDESGEPSAGNGALMRIAPLLVPYLKRPSPALWADAALAGMLTHNDRASNACCVSFTHLLWECLHRSQPPEPAWWPETFLAVARELEGSSRYSSLNHAHPYQGPLWQFVARELGRALQEGWSSLEACERWHSGAYLLETMPCVLYILARHGHDPEEAILRAVNDTRDNDTIASLVGAAVGALHGRGGLPPRWIANLVGRTTADDDWQVFELIEAAKQRFWHADPPLSRANLQAVLRFLPIFTRPGFVAGEWILQDRKVAAMSYAPEVDDFHTALGVNGFLQPFAWRSWYEGDRLVDEPALLDQASLQTLRKLLTAHIRAERFSEGHLAAQFDSGHMVRLLERLAVIEKTMEN